MNEDDDAICEAMEKLIHNCTSILGWCYTGQQVEITKQKQRELSRSALAQMEVYCPETETNLSTQHSKPEMEPEIKITTTTTTTTRTLSSVVSKQPSTLPSIKSQPGSAPMTKFSFTVFCVALSFQVVFYKA